MFKSENVRQKSSDNALVFSIASFGNVGLQDRWKTLIGGVNSFKLLGYHGFVLNGVQIYRIANVA